MNRYTEHDKVLYEPPACPLCHQRVNVNWTDVTVCQDPEPMFTPGRWECPTPGCPNSARRR